MVDNSHSEAGKAESAERSKVKPKTSADSEDPTPPPPWRRTVGYQMDLFSSAINENLVVARYGIAASVALLTAYGLSHTPLFFRFSMVRDIPASYFQSRRTIHCRLVRVLEPSSDAAPGSEQVEQPIVCLVRHLSPISRLLPRPIFDICMDSSPSVATGMKLEDNRHELLQVEIAGIRQAPFFMPHHPSSEQPGEWLHRLAQERTRISCQLLTRRVKRLAEKRRRDSRVHSDSTALALALALAHPPHRHDEYQRAVCRMRYRPLSGSGRVFRIDLGESLVKFGRAGIASAMHVPDESLLVVDTTTNVQDLRADTDYMERLERAEYEAAKESKGMWADRHVRESRSDVMEEVEFETNANMAQKLWRWIRGA